MDQPDSAPATNGEDTAPAVGILTQYVKDLSFENPNAPAVYQWQDAPQVGVISQYVKDLSFENPNAPAVYQWQSQPKIEVDFNIGATKLNDEIHEVQLKIEVRATAEGQTDRKSVV